MAGILLSYQDHRYRQVLKDLLMLGGHYCRSEDHAVHLLVVKSRKIFQFFLRIVLCHREEHLITAIIQYRENSFYDLAYGCGCDLWYDHTDHFCFFGTECLCLDGRAIACLLYNFADRLFLLF